MPAGGISPPLNDSAAPIGRPRRRKAQPGLGPRSLRKSRLPLRSRRKHRPTARRSKRPIPSPRKSKWKQNRLGLNLNRKRQRGAAPLPRGQVRGIGAVGAATTRTALPAGLSIPPASANHGHWDQLVGTHHQLPKRNLPLPLNGRPARLSMIPRKYPPRVFAGVTAIPGWLRGLRNSK